MASMFKAREQEFAAEALYEAQERVTDLLATLGPLAAKYPEAQSNLLKLQDSLGAELAKTRALGL